MTLVVQFFQGLVNVLTGLLLPASGDIADMTALQVVMWAGIIFPFLGIIYGLIRRMSSAGGG